MFEVELKYPVESHQEIRQRLTTMDAKSISGAEHLDEYFNQTLLDFAGNDIALRIRSRDDSHTLTYKGPNLDQHAKVREEIEIEFTPEDKQRFRRMLLGMGFHSVSVVRKHRDSTLVRWRDEKVQICFDTVDQVGTFVELELVVDTKSQIASAKQTLEDLAQELKIQSAPTTVSYLEMLLDMQN